MLYVTTRNNIDPCTVYHTLKDNRGPEGGFYLPLRHPVFSEEEILKMQDMSFGEIVSGILNRLLGSRLSAWDIDFWCSRNPIRLRALNSRYVIAEAWHTPSGEFDLIAKTVAEKIFGESWIVTDWMNTVVRAAVWFGVFSELQRNGIGCADVSLVSGDFLDPISVWYARRWGLPMGKIICCCNENNAFWELLSHGQLRTDAVAVSTAVAAADIAVPKHLERLIYEAGGTRETAKYLDVCRRGGTYYPGDAVLSRMRRGMYAGVVSSHRVDSVVSGVLSSHGYSMTPETAMAYAGAQDYRSKTGETRPVIIWAEEKPGHQREYEVASSAEGEP